MKLNREQFLRALHGVHLHDAEHPFVNLTCEQGNLVLRTAGTNGQAMAYVPFDGEPIKESFVSNGIVEQVLSRLDVVDEVTIEREESCLKIQFDGGSGTVKTGVAAPEGLLRFQQPEPAKLLVEFDVDNNLSRKLAFVASCIDREEKNAAAFMGISFFSKDGKMTVYASDRHKLARQTVCDTLKNFEVLVSVKAVASMTEGAHVKLYDESCTVVKEHVGLYYKNLQKEGSPAQMFEKAMMDCTPEKFIVLKRMEFLHVVGLASYVASLGIDGKIGGLSLSAKGSKTLVVSVAADGENMSTDSVEVVDGKLPDDFSMKLFAEYLVRLKHLTAPLIRIELGEKLAPCALYEVDGGGKKLEGFKYVFTQMRR